MHSKKQALGENIANIKTTIIVFESQKNIADKLKSCLEMNDIHANIKSYAYNSKFKVKTADIYIINAENLENTQKYDLIQKILTINSQANMFLLHDEQNEKNVVNQKFANIISPIKNGEAIKSVIECNESGLQQIIESIQQIEYTKKKLGELWQKLAKAC
jgi:hypothetical protein